MAREAEPKFRKEGRREVGRRFQGVGSWKGDAKALCKHQEAETSGLCLVFGIEYITDTPLTFVEPKNGFVTAWDCLFYFWQHLRQISLAGFHIRFIVLDCLGPAWPSPGTPNRGA